VPLARVTVVLPSNATRELCVYEGERISDLVRSFAQEHQLDTESQRELLAHLNQRFVGEPSACAPDGSSARGAQREARSPEMQQSPGTPDPLVAPGPRTASPGTPARAGPAAVAGAPPAHRSATSRGNTNERWHPGAPPADGTAARHAVHLSSPPAHLDAATPECATRPPEPSTASPEVRSAEACTPASAAGTAPSPFVPSSTGSTGPTTTTAVEPAPPGSPDASTVSPDASTVGTPAAQSAAGSSSCTSCPCLSAGGVKRAAPPLRTPVEFSSANRAHYTPTSATSAVRATSQEATSVLGTSTHADSGNVFAADASPAPSTSDASAGKAAPPQAESPGAGMTGQRQESFRAAIAAFEAAASSSSAGGATPLAAVEAPSASQGTAADPTAAAAPQQGSHAMTPSLHRPATDDHGGRAEAAAAPGEEVATQANGAQRFDPVPAPTAGVGLTDLTAEDAGTGGQQSHSPTDGGSAGLASTLDEGLDAHSPGPGAVATTDVTSTSCAGDNDAGQHNLQAGDRAASGAAAAATAGGSGSGKKKQGGKKGRRK